MDNAILELQRQINDLKRQIGQFQAGQFSTHEMTWLSAPLTSTSWDGDAYSTTAKTLIYLSAVFGVPAGVRAVYVWTATRDSGSAAGDTILLLSPNNTAGSGLHNDCSGQTNDSWERAAFWVPCDANGDIYYQITASGAGTLDAHMQIWGYER